MLIRIAKIKVTAPNARKNIKKPDQAYIVNGTAIYYSHSGK